MKKPKILIIRSSENSPWGSCKVISPNLQATYGLMEKDLDVEWFDLPMKYLPEEVVENELSIVDLAQKIASTKYDRIISVDHVPVQPMIFVNLQAILPLTKIPPIIFHIYGDFTYFAVQWREFSETFLNHKVKFIVASDAQKKLVQSFMTKQADIEKFYFPVDSNAFSFSNDLRVEKRKEMQVSDETFIVSYAGRISLQKNVDVLIKLLNSTVGKLKTPVELWIVGAFDDQGAHFANIMTYEGYLFTKISQIVEKSKNIKVKFLGQKNKKDLRALMCASDAFISLSIYHDEDYGMSPAEALACGLPSLLTHWGGYSSFVSKEDKWDCSLMRVELSEFGHMLDKSAMDKFMHRLLVNKTTMEQRDSYSKAFLEQFSIMNSPDKLYDLIKTDAGVFPGCSWKLKLIIREYFKTRPRDKMNLDMTPGNNNLYYDIYKHYVADDTEVLDD